ncbi:hypothetical protein ON010_g12703 [Phytophthora cinnamomi]|nr:hypothetical protein ON010_g12703 [Phytophthora cinnamomi]
MNQFRFLTVPPSPAIVFSVAEGYPALRTKLQEHFESKLPDPWNSEFVVYYKPTNNAYQEDFQVLLSDSSVMQVQLETAWHKARLRSGGQAGFVLELSIYVPRPAKQTASLRRATAARIQEQMTRVSEVLREQGISTGPATQTYVATTQARLPEGAPVVVPNNTTFHQLQHVDMQQAAKEEAQQEAQRLDSAEYQLIRVKIQDVPVAMQVNVSDLRAALGLPRYSLRPPFRAPVNVETLAAVVNMEDTNHQDG